jgi:D-alanine-D-alanine ligase
MTRIAVLAGGRSPEREVSLRSGHRVCAALRARGHDAVLLDPAEGPFVENLSGARVSACYIALHGKDGEDGTMQRLLEAVGVPYTGSGSRACQLAFDKVLMKESLDAAGIPTPPWTVIEAAALRDLAAGPVLGTATERIGLPLVVKPSRAGSAMGLSFVDREQDLPHAVMNALSFADAAVIERRVDGVEVAAGIVGRLEPFPLVEVVPKSGVFDYAARYTPGATEYFAPARLPSDVTSSCLVDAGRALEVLGVRDVGRADVMVGSDGRGWTVDVNVSPGMTDTSLLPMAARAAGLTFEELCDHVVRLALDRAADA